MIKTVEDLRKHFPTNIKFNFFGADGTPQANAMLDDKIDRWIVLADFTVLVVLK